jgi:hypothetical protein
VTRSARLGRIAWDIRRVWQADVVVRMRSAFAVVLLAVFVAGACSSDGETVTTDSTPANDDAGCARVVAVNVRESGGTFTFDVTVESTDTGWDKYADAWEVRSPAGDVLGMRELLHPHENEQPFTRSLSGVEIPDDLREVTVAARDSVLGFCGETVTLALPGRS